jgi:hypothetical protein
LPPRAIVVQARDLNRRFLARMEAERCVRLHRAADYDLVIGETNWLYQAWDKLDDAQLMTTEENRWQALEELRQLIGNEAFFTGTMPPPVPIWRFREID